MSPGLTLRDYCDILRSHIRAGEMGRFADTLDRMLRRYPSEGERFIDLILAANRVRDRQETPT